MRSSSYSTIPQTATANPAPSISSSKFLNKLRKGLVSYQNSLQGKTSPKTISNARYMYLSNYMCQLTADNPKTATVLKWLGYVATDYISKEDARYWTRQMKKEFRDPKSSFAIGVNI